MYLYNKNKLTTIKQNATKRQQWLKKYITDNLKPETLINCVETLYNNGYNAKDLEDFINRDKNIDSDKKMQPSYLLKQSCKRNSK